MDREAESSIKELEVILNNKNEELEIRINRDKKETEIRIKEAPKFNERRRRREKVFGGMMVLSGIVVISVIMFVMCSDSRTTEPLGTLNEDVSPCDNFYQHACSRYETDSFTMSDDFAFQKAKEIVASPEKEDDSEWTKLAKRMYSRCLDETRSTTDTSSIVAYLKVLTDVWSRDEPPPLLQDDDDQSDDSLNDHLDARWVKQVNAYYTAQKTRLGPKVRAYKYYFKYITKILTLLGLNREKAESVAKIVIGYEREMAMNERLATYELFLHVHEKSSRNSTEEEYADDDYLTGNTTSEMTNFTHPFFGSHKGGRNEIPHRYYRIWAKIDELLPVMPYEFRTVLARFATDDPEDATLPEPEDSCFTLTSRTASFALADMVLRDVIDNGTKSELEKLIQAIRREFENFIISTSRSWLNESAVEEFIENVKSIKVVLGLPDIITEQMNDRSNLERVEAILKNSLLDSFIDYYRAARNWVSAENKNPMLYHWLLVDFTMSNAVSKDENITLFTGALMPPMFDRHQSIALNYAGIGSILAHELMHSLRAVMKKEKLSWDGSAHWIEMKECLRKQYMERFEFGVRCSYLSSAEEDYADHGAITIAYNAYINHNGTRHYSSEAGDQRKLFFVGYSRNWCENPSALSGFPVPLWYLDTHSPGRFRVNVPLSNFRPFSEVMGCSVGDDMNRNDSCLRL